jgi:hypothetical protein
MDFNKSYFYKGNYIPNNFRNDEIINQIVLLRPKGAGHKQTPVVWIGERDRRVRLRSAGTKQHLFYFRHLAGCGTVVYRLLLARKFVRVFRWGREVVEESRIRFWRLLWQPGGALPESRLASLAGAVLGGVYTR